MAPVTELARNVLWVGSKLWSKCVWGEMCGTCSMAFLVLWLINTTDVVINRQIHKVFLSVSQVKTKTEFNSTSQWFLSSYIPTPSLILLLPQYIYGLLMNQKNTNYHILECVKNVYYIIAIISAVTAKREIHLYTSYKVMITEWFFIVIPYSVCVWYTCREYANLFAYLNSNYVVLMCN